MECDGQVDDVPSGSIVLFVVLLLLSAFFSSSETAFSSAKQVRLRNYEAEKRKGARKAVYIVEHFDQALSTILVGNNLVNIAAATLASHIAIQLFGPNIGVIISTFVVTILVLIFGEILPKSFAKEFAETYSLKVSGILHFLIRLFTPINWCFTQLKKAASYFIRKKERAPTVTEEEIKVMLDMSEEEGVIDKQEKELVHRSLEFDDIIVKEILKPRPDMITVEITQPVDEIVEVFFENRFSRLPVYEENIDNVIGILSERDFLTAYIRDKENIDLRALLREPLFVVGSMKISVLLPELQKQNVHMAIVIDEFGGTSGLITLEDILEEIVGEIWDEHDERIKLVKQLGPSSYMFYADYAVDDFANFTSILQPETTNHTIGGWVIEELQRIPDEDEEFTYGPLTMKVAEAEEKRIRKIHVKINNEQPEQENRLRLVE